jgi:hypothetical protein
MVTCEVAEWPPLTAGRLIERMGDTFRHLPDARQGGNHPRDTLEDAALSALAVFFTHTSVVS